MSHPERYTGVFRFPGIRAFLERPGFPDDAVIQIDDPFTGVYDDLAARGTCIRLQARHQDGDPADLSGKILMRDVMDVLTPVLFLFD